MNYFYYIDKGYVTEQGDCVSYDCGYYDNEKFRVKGDAIFYALKNLSRINNNEYFDIMTSSSEVVMTIEKSKFENIERFYIVAFSGSYNEDKYIFVDKKIFFKLFNEMIYHELVFDLTNNVLEGIHLTSIFIEDDYFEKVEQLIKEMEAPENA